MQKNPAKMQIFKNKYFKTAFKYKYFFHHLMQYSSAVAV